MSTGTRHHGVLETTGAGDPHVLEIRTRVFSCLCGKCPTDRAVNQLLLSVSQQSKTSSC